MSKRIRVLVVEDSPVVQHLLRHIIDGDPRLLVVGVAADAEEAMRMIGALEPDVVTMDIRLPRMNGFEATRWIMRDHPLPIVVVASDVGDRTLDISMNALRAGALSVVAKPAGAGLADYDRVADHLRTQLVIMSEVKVVRQHGGRTASPSQSLPPLPPHVPVEVVGLVASTGGPGALARVLAGLPAAFATPILVVQHMGAPFMAGFAHWLGTVSMLPVSVATDGERVLPGHVYVAPGDVHLRMEEGVLRHDTGPPVQGQRPSGDVLFDSLALAGKQRAAGVLLTGMGQDGARGLLMLRRAGGHTIAEDRSSAVIWGMPGAAVAMDAAKEVLPVDAIAQRLQQLTEKKQPGGRR